MAGGYSHQPQGPEALARQIRDLRNQIDVLRKQIAGIGIQVDPASNSIVLGGSRAVKVLDTDGHTVAIIGALPSQFNRLDGSAQPGMALYREDGTLAAMLGDANPTVAPYKQSFQIVDRANNIVVADDTNGGHGLANPYVSGASFSDSNITRWPSTTGTTWTEIAYAYHTMQNPRFQFDIDLQADASTTGQFRIMVTNHTGTAVQIDATQTVAGTFTHWTKFEVAPPTGTNWGELVYISLQAQRTVGTGTIRAIVNRWEGDQTP